jgi:hypothetical protein
MHCGRERCSREAAFSKQRFTHCQLEVRGQRAPGDLIWAEEKAAALPLRTGALVECRACVIHGVSGSQLVPRQTAPSRSITPSQQLPCRPQTQCLWPCLSHSDAVQ